MTNDSSSDGERQRSIDELRSNGEISWQEIEIYSKENIGTKAIDRVESILVLSREKSEEIRAADVQACRAEENRRGQWDCIS